MALGQNSKLEDTALTTEDETLKAVKPSLAKEEPSPEAPLTYTKEEYDRLLQLDRMKAGRDVKTLTEREQRLATEKASWLKERDEAIKDAIEEWELRDQPEELKDLKAERQQKVDAEAGDLRTFERMVLAAFVSPEERKDHA